MTGRIFKIIVAAPFALIPLAAVTGKSVSFEKMVLKPNELTVLEYSSSGQENTGIIERARHAVSMKIAKFNPFLAVDENSGSPVRSEQDEASGQADDGQLRVTLTVLNAGGNMAVINDRLMREGDSIRGMRVKRIENNRVLMINRQSVPVYLEGSK
ncbi:MAG: hypothetical protein A2052_07360 [Deltaproteobacteria bacterium GWA2_54_12]|nr:MAG: hypothetical protein A2052_07360 [Deltaproteobacteria bacterium GWA2_54_12]